MYLEYFGLNRAPFHITPDPDFLFLSPSHKEAFATVVYGVEQRKGFVSLVGEVGTGKTTVLRAYLRRIEKTDIRPIYLFNPALNFEDLLRLVLRELGATPEGDNAQQLLDQLQWVLIEEYKAGRNVALIVDEAQNIPVGTLESLRMLSNLETTTDKLIQIVLVGQPELQDKLDVHALRQLRQRIAVRAVIKPLSRAESTAYIHYRLQQAGCIRSDVFSQAALRAVVRAARGNPRTINILCDNALVAAFGGGEFSVSRKTVREVLADVTSRPWKRYRRVTAAAAAALAVVCVSGLAVLASRGGEESGTAAVLAHTGTPAVSSDAVPETDMDEAHAESAPPRPGPERTRPDHAARTVELMERATRPSIPKETTQATAAESAAAETPAPPEETEAEAEAIVVAPALEEDAPAETAEEATAEEPPMEEPPALMASARAAALPLDRAVSRDASRQEAPAAPAPETREEPVTVPRQPAPASPRPDSAATGYVTREVHPGDNLSELVRQVYGELRPALIEAVRAANPQIKDVNVIWYGDTLRFPMPASDTAAAQRASAPAPQE
jgi:general secretion pathway protein A